jgi:uncharacterized protein YndB with AHSA1/START domain
MTTPANLPYLLERSLIIRARPETVFRFFTDPERWASWWGDGSTIDPRPGGRVFIRYPNAVEARGEIIEISPPDRLTFTYGYASGTPIAPGASLVRIQLEATGAGTRLHFVHEFSDAAVRDQHVQGWRYQLSIFANVVSNEVGIDAPARVDEWLSAWSDVDSRSRLSTLTRIAAPHVQFRDRFSAVAGLEDLAAHLEATHQFMPDLRLHREGSVRHCQGVAACDWVAIAADGHEQARGTNVFVFDADGRVESVTGLWNPSPQP